MSTPSWPACAPRLDLFDANKVELGRQRIAEGDAFDVDQALNEALDQEQDDAAADLTGGGIFEKG